jgi:hypothetical protein
MIEVVKFTAEHLKKLDEQEATKHLASYFTDKHAELLAQDRYAYTGLCGARVVVCAGIVETWPGRGQAWAIFDRSCLKEFIHIHAIVKRFLDAVPIKRVEAAVDCNFKNGHRWIKALGFELEAERMTAYQPDGSDCSLYARVK